MGKKRLAVLDEPIQGKEKKRKEKTEKVRVPGLKGGQRVVTVASEPVIEATPSEKPKDTHLRPFGLAQGFGGQAEARKEKKTQKIKAKKLKGKNYLAAKAKVDPQKKYSIEEAVKLLKQTNLTSFDGTAEIHLTVIKKGLKGEINLPYFQGRAKKVVIVDEKVLEQIEAGKIDFDILLATPAFMPKLVKYAKVLGPKGLMPNPKNGTVVDQPEEAIKNFQKTSISFKTEQNAPLIHAVFGKVSQKEEELVKNLEAFLTAVGGRNIKKAVIKSTMGPAIKLEVGN